MSAVFRSLLRALPACLALGAAVSLFRAVLAIHTNDWIGLGLKQLAVASVSRITISSLALVMAAAVFLILLRWFLGSRFTRPEKADAVTAWICGFLAAAAIAAPWGYQVNRYTYKAFWFLTYAREVFGVQVPPALFTPKVLLANAEAVLAGAVALVACYYAVRLGLKGCRRTTFWDTRRYRLLGAASALAVAALALPGAALGPDKDDYPNVILISLDTLRADHLSCYGYPAETSPNIDQLARDGVLFEDVVAQSNWTLPSHMSIMTSQLPAAHGVKSNEDRLHERKVTLAEILKNAGYHTFAVTGGFYVDARFGFGQGFDEYLADTLGQALSQEEDRLGQGLRLEHQLPRVFSKLSGLEDPFFLFLHSWDTHAPYVPHEGLIEEFSPSYSGELEVVTHEYIEDVLTWRERPSEDDVRRIRALYDNEIRYVDQSLGELIQELKQRGLYETTIIVVTSDHGDELTEHGLMSHGVGLYQPEIFVPLIITYPPAIPANRRVPVVARSMDIAPTILELAGVPVPEKAGREFHGRSLAGSWDKPLEDVVAISEGNENSGAALRLRELKYIRNQRHERVRQELYDLDEDPHETNNLKADSPETVSEMEDQLNAVIQPLNESPSPQKRLKQDQEFLEKLRRLGYLQ